MLLSEQACAEALRRLAAAYPDAKPALEYRTPFELLVSTMLAAQCTDRQVNKCTRVLYEKYNTPAQFAALTEEQLEPYIKSCGFFRAKGKNILATSRLLVERYGGQVPPDRDALTQLPGVGRKTANVLGAVLWQKEVMPVDTHVFRVSNRIGLTTNSKTPLQTELTLEKNIPPHLLPVAHHWLILHGRYVCTARAPKCGECGIAVWCRKYAADHKAPKG